MTELCIHSSRNKINGLTDNARCAGIQVASNPNNAIARTKTILRFRAIPMRRTYSASAGLTSGGRSGLQLDFEENDLAGGLVEHVVLNARLAEIGFADAELCL